MDKWMVDGRKENIPTMPKKGMEAKIADPNSLGGQIRAARLNSPGKPPMAEFAKLLGIATSTLWRYENNKTRPYDGFMAQVQALVAPTPAPVAAPPIEASRQAQKEQSDGVAAVIVDLEEEPQPQPPLQAPAPSPPLSPLLHQHSFSVPVTLSVDGLLLVKSCDSCPVCFYAKRYNHQQGFRHFDEIHVFSERDREEYEEQQRERGRGEEYRPRGGNWNTNTTPNTMNGTPPRPYGPRRW